MKTILLKFAGPLQAWGTGSHFENRYTDRYPSKSAVIGIIAASLGYRREQTENITELNKLDFGVRLDQQGKILQDFHIAKKYLANGKMDRSYVTYRYYLQDAVFAVAISSENDSLIENIDSALKAPYFQSFLGRRSLPLNADFYIGKTNQGVIESLNTLPWQASSWYRKLYKNYDNIKLESYVDSNLQPDPKPFIVRDLVTTFSQKGRAHSFRTVSKIYIDLSLQHDAFSAIGV